MSGGMDEVQRRINEEMANWKGNPDKIEIARLRAEVERLKADITYADKHAAKVEDLLWGTAKENEKLKALTVKADEAIERQQQDLEEAADRAADCDILRAEIERLKEQLESPFMDGYETAKEEYRPRLIAAEAENERLKEAIKVAIRQHEDGNKGLAHRTLCEAIYGEQA